MALVSTRDQEDVLGNSRHSTRSRWRCCVCDEIAVGRRGRNTQQGHERDWNAGGFLEGSWLEVVERPQNSRKGTDVFECRALRRRAEDRLHCRTLGYEVLAWTEALSSCGSVGAWKWTAHDLSQRRKATAIWAGWRRATIVGASARVQGLESTVGGQSRVEEWPSRRERGVVEDVIDGGRRAGTEDGRGVVVVVTLLRITWWQGSTMPLSDRRRERRCGQRDIRFAWMGPGDDERRGGRGEGRCKTRSMVWFDGSQD